MEYIVVCIVALIVAGLMLFSGFGLGTLLMPAFAIFFPLPVAISATAVVHLANNIFKVFLVGKNANWNVVLRFALIASIAAIGGAMLLGLFSSMNPIATYYLGSKTYEVTIIKLTIAVIIIVFAMFDIIPKLKKISFKAIQIIVGIMLILLGLALGIGLI